MVIGLPAPVQSGCRLQLGVDLHKVGPGEPRFRVEEAQHLVYCFPRERSTCEQVQQNEWASGGRLRWAREACGSCVGGWGPVA